MIRFCPETGRTHQIRAHALYGLGAAIVGDPVYGGGTPAPMLLHSQFLSLKREGKHPVEATAPLPERFAAAGFGPEHLHEGAHACNSARRAGGTLRYSKQASWAACDKGGTGGNVAGGKLT